MQEVWDKEDGTTQGYLDLMFNYDTIKKAVEDEAWFEDNENDTNVFDG